MLVLMIVIDKFRGKVTQSVRTSAQICQFVTYLNVSDMITKNHLHLKTKGT